MAAVAAAVAAPVAALLAARAPATARALLAALAQVDPPEPLPRAPQVPGVAVQREPHHHAAVAGPPELAHEAAPRLRDDMTTDMVRDIPAGLVDEPAPVGVDRVPPADIGHRGP
jgi:hypothetical protein